MLKTLVRLQCIGYSLKNKARNLRGDQKGVTALEYTLIAGVTVVAIGAALYTGTINADVKAIWAAITTDLDSAKTAAG